MAQCWFGLEIKETLARFAYACIVVLYGTLTLWLQPDL